MSNPGRFGRTRGVVERGRGRVEGAIEGLEAARPDVSAIDVAFSVFERDRAAGGGLLAGALAYRFYFMLLPLTLLLVVGLGYLATEDSGAPADLAREFGIKGVAAGAVADSAELSSRNQILALAAGAVALLWASAGVARATRLAHAIAWDMPERRWPRLPAAALFAVGAVLILLAATSSTAWLREHTGIAGLLITVASSAGLFAGWLGVSWLLPHRDVKWTALAPGAVLVTVGFQALHLVTVLWIAHRVATASAAYGALGIALVLLLWLYLVGRLIVSSAMLNATLAARQNGR